MALTRYAKRDQFGNGWYWLAATVRAPRWASASRRVVSAAPGDPHEPRGGRGRGAHAEPRPAARRQPWGITLAVVGPARSSEPPVAEPAATATGRATRPGTRSSRRSSPRATNR